MRKFSSGIPSARRLVDALAIATSLALLPAAAAAQDVIVEPSVSAAHRALRYTPASLSLDLTPFALGDLNAGSRLGVNTAAGGSVALGIHGLVAGTQVGVYYGSRAFGTLHREDEQSFGITAGRPLWTARTTSRLGLTLGVAGAVGYRPGSSLYEIGRASCRERV